MESFFREFIYITYHLHVSWYFHSRRTFRCLWRCHGNGWRSIVLCIIITRTFAMILTWKFWVARRFRGAMTYFDVFYAFFRDCWRLIEWPRVRYKRLPKLENFYLKTIMDVIFILSGWFEKVRNIIYYSRCCSFNLHGFI